MKHFKISTSVVCSFLTLLVLVLVVMGTSIGKMAEIERLAGELNGRMVQKTRMADDIVDLGQQIHAIDAFMLHSSGKEQDGLVAALVESRLKAIEAKTAAYRPFMETDLEPTLLRNIERSRKDYLAVQDRLLAIPVEARAAAAEAGQAELDDAFLLANRQARGLAHFAETRARDARQQAADIGREARMTVIGVSALVIAIGLLIMVGLRSRVFRPLATITRALLGIANGRLDVAVPPSGRGDEIDDLAQALNVFRRNALALAAAHEETQAAHQLAESLARHDVLTGLPNRRVLADDITAAIGRSERYSKSCAVLVLDLDRFKPVNDIYGHGAGDKVLCEIAQRLKAVVRAGEAAARLGGDEFSVVIEFDTGSDAPIRLAKRMIDSFAAPIAIGGTTVTVGTSIGIAVWPTDGTDPEALLHAADLAMLEAKREERGTFRFFEPALDVQLRVRADLEARLRVAIAEDRIKPHFQPLVDLRHDRIRGFEILARWHDGERVRPPCDFIPVAEDAGLIPELTYSVLRQACRDARHWPDELTLALNITPAQISDPQLPPIILDLIEQEGFAARRLELEITENALIGDFSSAKSVIAEFQRHGVKISLDDFGTGYSSLHHLRELKFDKIKIDRSFVQSMLANPDSSTIVETIVSLGKNLGISTVAEGIEDIKHLDSLVACGCDFGQGYYLGRPLAAAQAGELIVTYGTERCSAQAA